MSNSTTATLTISDLLKLGQIVEAAQTGSQVTFLKPETGLTSQGTARSIGTDTGMFLGSEDDVRDAYLRITMATGIERFEKVSDLLAEIDTTFFFYGK